MKFITVVFFLIYSSMSWGVMSKHSAWQSPEARDAYKDIEATFGFVPTFLRVFPKDSIAGAWEEMKGVQMSGQTAMAPKYKELVGLAVASQIPCKYCEYFHTQAAKLNGATDEELAEAVAVAGVTRHWATFVSGAQLDEQVMRAEIDQMFVNMRMKRDEENAGTKAKEPPIVVISAQTAYKDIDRTFGFVPNFLRQFPVEGIVGAWKETKSVVMDPDSYLANRNKALIGLAVATQSSCRNCIYYEDQSAKFSEATGREISEAVAVASIVRHWSTYLNGMQLDENTFRTEVDRAMKFVKRKMLAEKNVAMKQ